MRRRSHKRIEIRPETVKRIVIYGALLLILSALQCSFFARLRFLPATPDLILCVVLGILLLDSEQAAVIAAVAGGFIVDAVGGIGISFGPLFYLLAVALMSLLAKKVMPSVLSFAVLLLPALLLRAGYTLLGIWMSVGSFPISTALRQVLLPEALMTLLFGFLVYALLRLCRIPLRDWRDRSRL